MPLERGELYWLDWEPARGVEQRGRRPALIVQNDTGNATARYTVVVALSTAALPRPYPFIVPLAVGEGGLPGTRASHVNCAQISTVDKSRLLDRIGKLDDRRMVQVSEALRYELSLE